MACKIIQTGVSDPRVTGTLAGLAASGTATVCFDLGTDWENVELAQVCVSVAGPSTGLTAVQVSFADAVQTVINPNRRVGPLYGAAFGSINAAITTAGGANTVTVGPMGRFLLVTATNADATNATGAATTVTLQAFIDL